MPRLNKYIRVAGMKRNGNHGIVNWILSQHRGKATFRNAAHRFEFIKNVASDPIDAFRKTEGLLMVDLHTPGDKELFLVTYEDRPIEKALDPEIPSRYAEWVGHQIQRSISVVILRDPFNYFSSRLQAENNGTYPLSSWGPCFSQGNADVLWKMWKSYAQTYLAYQIAESEDNIAVSYNHWVHSLGYRNKLCLALGTKNDNDESRKVVTGWGAGSSFDKGRWQQPEAYLNRWRVHRDHPEFQKALKDEELMSLSEEIFGDIMDIASIR